MPTNSYLFNQPNVGATRWANTGALIAPRTATAFPTLGSPTGPTYTPGALPPLAPSLAPAATTPQTFSLLNLTKNPAIQSANSDLLKRVTGNAAAGDSDLAAYTKKLLGFQTGADTALGQETTSINDVFNGKLASDLAGARNRYATGARNAMDQAVAEADAARKSAAIAGGGMGGSSYFNRQAIATGVGANARLAADLADRENRDILAARQTQNQLLGVRNRLGTENAANLLLPTQARNGMTAAQLAALSGVTSLDNANNFYGINDGLPNYQFDPSRYPVAGPTQYGGSQPGPAYLTPPGGNQTPQRGSGIADLIRAMQRQQQGGGAPTVNPGTYDYFNDPNYDLTAGGWQRRGAAAAPEMSAADQAYYDRMARAGTPYEDSGYTNPYGGDNLDVYVGGGGDF